MFAAESAVEVGVPAPPGLLYAGSYRPELSVAWRAEPDQHFRVDQSEHVCRLAKNTPVDEPSECNPAHTYVCSVATVK